MPRLLVDIRGDRMQTEAAALSGISQSKISRAEQGRFPLDENEAEAYARALGASAAHRRQLVQLAAAHRAENIGGRKHLIRNAHAIQRRIGDLESQVRIIRSWVPDVVTGVLQTPAYTVALLGTDPDERWWVPRRARLALLDDLGRTFQLLIGEAALRWGIGSHEIMADQTRHLIAASERGNVQFGIVPLDRIHAIAMPRGFQLYGEGTVSVATNIGTSFATEPSDVAEFVAEFAQLDQVALHGAQARDLLGRIEQDYRRRA